jgi:hypothetical protein
MWTRAAAMTVGTVLTAAAGATAAPAQPERVRPVLAVSIVDLAYVPRHVLGHAAEDASAIYDLAGVSLVWHTTRSGECCQAPADANWVRVIVQGGRRSEVLGAEVNAGRSTMGFAPCGASADCQIAYIFYDRIEELARRTAVPIGRILGLAIAHEIGHMLLPPPSHSREGIMRSALDLKRSFLPLFTVTQAGAIRTRLVQRKYGSDR